MACSRAPVLGCSRLLGPLPGPRQRPTVRDDRLVRRLHDLLILSLQTLDLMRRGATVRAAVNVAASVLLCVGAVALGHLVGAHFNGEAVHIVQTAVEEDG